jgi:hypothetical protein
VHVTQARPICRRKDYHTQEFLIYARDQNTSRLYSSILGKIRIIGKPITVLQLVKEYLHLCRTQRLIVVFSVLAHINSAQTLTSYILRIYFNITLPYKTLSPKDLLPSDVPTKIQYPFLTIAMLHPFHPPQFDHSNNISLTVQITKPIITQIVPAFCFFLPLMSKFSPQRSVLEHTPSSVLLSQLERPSSC